MLPALKRFWARLWLRRAGFSARYGDLDRLYAIEDPWQLASAKEHARFLASNALIQRLVPDCDRLLELGSGEGYQSLHLRAVCRDLTGLEVSRAAVDRARQRCPSARFLVGKGEEAGHMLAGERFDLITAFEVLYYAADVPAVLTALQGLSDRILVTYYDGRAQRMRPFVTGPGWTRLDDITAEDTRWEVHWWQRPAA